MAHTKTSDLRGWEKQKEFHFEKGHPKIKKLNTKEPYDAYAEGRKDDDGKLRWDKAPWLLFEKIVESITKNPHLRWDLLPSEPLEAIVEILTYGAKTYGSNNWQNVDSDRYFAADLRHIVADKKGEALDKQSGFLHLAHAACNSLFRLWKKIQDRKPKNFDYKEVIRVAKWD